MWKMKAKRIPVIVGTLGMLKKGTHKYVNEIPGNLSLPEIQKIALNSTAHLFTVEETLYKCFHAALY